MRTVAKWFVRIGAGTAILLLVLVVAVFVILRTQQGTRWVIDRVDAAIPGTIGVENFDGSLWSGLDIPVFNYRDVGRELQATGVVVTINWSLGIRGRLDLPELSAATVVYQDFAPPETSPKPFELALDPLPVGIGITRSRIGQLTLVRQDEPLVIHDIAVDKAQLTGSRLRVNAVSAAADPVVVSATTLIADLTGDIPLNLNLSWSLEDNSWSGSGAISGSLAALEFDHAVAGPYLASATGQLQLLHRLEPEVNALVSWQSWVIGGYELENGQARVRGTPNNYSAEFDLTAALPVGTSARVSGTAVGNTERLSAFEVQVSSPSGIVNAAGSMMWQPMFAAEAQVHATGIDPSIIVENLSGSLDVDTHISVDDNVSLVWSAASISGVLNGAEINASGDGHLTSEEILCRACLIAVGDNRISIDGSRGSEEFAVTLSVDAPSLHLLWPGITGSLNGDGNISGARKHPEFTGEFHGRKLVFENWSAEEISLLSRASTVETVDVTASVTTLVNAGSDFGSFTVLGKGPPDALDVDIGWNFRDLNISATGNVTRSDELTAGVVTHATITDPNTGTWSLDDRMTFSIQDGDLSVEQHKWMNGNGELQVTRVSRVANELNLVASIVSFPLQTANSFLPPSYRLNGIASAEVDVAQQSGLWSGSARWRQEGTVLSVLDAYEQSTEVAIPEVSVDVEFHDGGADISASLNIEPGVTGELDLALDGLSFDSPVVAELRLSGNDWFWVPSVVPDIDKFEGVISATVNATGPLMAPEFNGSLNWRNGSLAVPALNVPITEIDIAVSGASDGAAFVKGSAKAGDGELSVDGRFEDLMRSSRSAEISLSGSGAELVNWPEYRLWASPDLVVAGTSAGWTINGKVDVPRAEIDVRELPENAVLISPDVNVLGRKETTEAPTRYSVESQLTLGTGVHVQAFGLDTKLQGDLLIKKPTDRAFSAEGQVTLVDGFFSAYGQKLTIQEGTLTFTGSLEDPLVDVRAVRVIESLDGQVTAGIHLRGRGQSLSSSVYSDPVMAEADALSYLIIGRPLSQATQSEGGELSGAAVALGVRQATRITEQIGQALGLDQLTLAGDGGDTTALVAGKQISPRLHARYAYGVFSRLGTLLVRYRMSQRLTLETGAGEVQSIDVLYQVEKQ